MAVAESSGIFIGDGDRRVLLKWHKLRRAASEPPFMAANLPRGLAEGASLEIDARALADGDWVCLHDDTLDGETSGSGPVASANATTIRSLRIRGGDYAPPLLADLARMVADAPPSGACLQIDLKQPAAGLTPNAVSRFAEIVSPVATRCLLSGTEWEAVRILGEAVPELRLGFDPLDMAEGRRFDDRESISAFVEEVTATAPGAVMFYVHYRFVLHALDLGLNPLTRLKAEGATVDIWTLDPTTPDIGEILRRVVVAGADQITTNDPVAMQRLWDSLLKDAGKGHLSAQIL